MHPLVFTTFGLCFTVTSYWVRPGSRAAVALALVGLVLCVVGGVLAISRAIGATP